jgi:hypothetical protein
VERWFAYITDELIRRGSHASVQALEADIRAWVDAWNNDPKPFVWTKTAEQSSNHSDDFLHESLAQDTSWPCNSWSREGIRTLDPLTTRRMLGVDLDGFRRIQAAQVGWLVGPDGSRRIQTDRLDDHRDDQGASDGESDDASIDASPTAH